LKVYSRSGAEKGTFYAAAAFPFGVPSAVAVEIGFQAIANSSSVPYEKGLATWLPDGNIISYVPVSGSSFTFPARTGGSVLVSTDAFSCEGGRTWPLLVARFGPSGDLRSVVDIGGQGCPVPGRASVVALSDDRDNTVIVLSTAEFDARGAMSASRMLARWVGATGTPLTEWFDTLGGGGTDMRLGPLIGGGAVLRSGTEWVATLWSGVPSTDSVPRFLQQSEPMTLAILPSGRGYSTIRDTTIDVFSASGDHCGALEFPEGSQLSIGLDGTVISLHDYDRCAATWWPQALR
jgi:hypothetical protein